MKVVTKRIFAIVTALCLLMVATGCSGTTPAVTPSPASPASSASPQAPAKVDFPTKPVTFMLPFDPGSAADIYGRAFAQVAEKYLGQKIIIENKSGASGAVGMLSMLANPADGYTFGYNGMNASTNIASGQAQGLNRDSLQPLALLCSDQCSISVHPNSEFKSIQDIITFAKANPGQFKYGGSQTRGTAEILCMLIEKYADVDFNYIAYDDGAKSLLGLLSGDIDCVSSTSSLMQPYYEDGMKEMVLVAQTFDQRADNLPDIPTLAECGMGLEGIGSYTSWKGIFIHPDTPEEILKVYDEVIAKAVEDPQWIEFITQRNQVNNFMNRHEFTPYFLNQIDELEELFATLAS
jgi:putative tricarboxylic transport membrane protein